MADKSFLSSNGTAWYEKTVTPSEGTAWHERVVKVTNGTTWYTNYPRIKPVTLEFVATWSQGWLGSGTRLDDGVWQGNIIVGSTTGYRGMYGFNQGAIAAHIGNYEVTSVKLLVNCYETTTNGSPDVQFGKHSYTSEPAGTWTGQNTDWTSYASLHVPNQGLGGYWVTLNPSQVRMANGTAIGGIALRAESNTDENMGKFNGVSSFATKLQITVLK
jgi:hypothetical protein